MKVHTKLIKIFSALLIAALLFAVLPVGEAVAQTTITVCASGCDHWTIQTAINAASPGDTVTVDSGSYTENVTVNKDITLLGLNSPEGANAAVVNGLLYVTADGAIVESLKVVPGSVTGQKAGISITASDTVVTGNYVTGMTGDGSGSIKGIFVYNDNPPALTNIEVSENKIENIYNSDKGSDGIMVQGPLDGVDILDNIVLNITSEGWAYGIEVTPTGSSPSNPPLDVLVDNNEINGVNPTGTDVPPYAGAGLSIDQYDASNTADASEVVLHYNKFLNTPYLIINKDTVNTLTATANWFGASSEPFNTYGLVLYNPWCYVADCSELYVDNGGSIQDAIGLVKNSTIYVAPGTYTEQLIIDKSLSLIGPNAGLSAGVVPEARGSEAVLKFPTGLTDYQEMIFIDAEDVTIDGFTLDGQDLDGSYDSAGIVSEEKNLTIKNNIIKNFNYIGILTSSYEYVSGSWDRTYYNTGLLIEDNLVTNEVSDRYYNYSAIYVQGDNGIVRGNVADKAYRGMQIQPYGNPETTQGLVENNHVKGYRTGIWFNYSEVDAVNWLIKDNLVEGIAYPAADPVSVWDGLLVQTFYGGTVSLVDNTVNFGTTNAPEVHPFGIIGWPTTSTGTVDLDATFANNTFERAVVITDGTNIIKTQPDMAFYSTIQDAVDAASPGDTINVAAGTYSEINILIDKSLALIGDPGDEDPGPGVDAPIIDGGASYGDAFKIANGVSNVTIKGFEVRNYTTAGFNGVGNAISAWVGSTSNITVQDNYFHNLGYNGILVGNAYNSDPNKWGDHTGWTVKSNIIEDFGYIGFELTNTSTSTIEDNVIHMSTPISSAIFSSARRNETGLTIKDNLIDGTPSTAYPVIYIYAYDLEMANPNLDDVLITGNTIATTGTPYQVVIWNINTGTVTNVKVEDNKLSTLRNLTSETIDASPNWWGSPCGPSSGAVVGDVVYSPWYVDEAMTQTSDGTAYVFPTDASTEAMNAIIACAAPGSTLTFESGTYHGGLVVDNNDLTFELNGVTVGHGTPAFTINGDDITINGPGVLDGTGDTDGSPGILVNAGADNFILDGVEVKNWVDGVQVAGAVESLKIVNNWLHTNSDAGLQVDAAPTGVVTIEGNLFKNNAGFGVAYGGTGSLDATYNSWGADSGPGTVEEAGTNVVYDPWVFSEIYLDMEPDTTGDQYTSQIIHENDFEVAVMADAENLSGLSFVFEYDTALLEMVGGASFTNPWDSAACLVLPDLVAGQVGYRCNIVTADTDWDGGEVARFTFHAIDSGTAIFDILHEDELQLSSGAVGGVKIWVNNADFNEPSTADRDIKDTNDGELAVYITQFTGFIDLQGRPNDSGALVSLYSDDAGVTLIAGGTSESSGKYTTAYESGQYLDDSSSYYILVDRDLFLPTYAYLSVDLPDSPLTTLQQLLLLGGDATDNNLIDIFDATCIGNAYGGSTNMCTGGPGANSDVNADGIVNIYDLTLMGGNFTKSESPWTP